MPGRSNIYLNYSLLLYLFLNSDEVTITSRSDLKKILRILFGVSDRRARQLIGKLYFDIRKEIDGIHIKPTKYLKEQYERKKKAIKKYITSYLISHKPR